MLRKEINIVALYSGSEQACLESPCTTNKRDMHTVVGNGLLTTVARVLSHWVRLRCKPRLHICNIHRPGEKPNLFLNDIPVMCTNSTHSENSVHVHVYTKRFISNTNRRFWGNLVFVVHITRFRSFWCTPMNYTKPNLPTELLQNGLSYKALCTWFKISLWAYEFCSVVIPSVTSQPCTQAHANDV
jgi:hypothetical protein